MNYEEEITSLKNKLLELESNNNEELRQEIARILNQINGHSHTGTDFPQVSAENLLGFRVYDVDDADTEPTVKANSGRIIFQYDGTDAVLWVNVLGIWKANKLTSTDYELVANKDTTITLGTSDIKYPSQKAVKTYVDNKISDVENYVDDAVAGISNTEVWTAGTTLQWSNDASKNFSGSGGEPGDYTILKTITLGEDLPTATFSFYATFNSGTTAKFMKNGYNIDGITYTTSGTHSKTLTSLVSGDYISIWGKTDGSGSVLENFRIYFKREITKLNGALLITALPATFVTNPTNTLT